MDYFEITAQGNGEGFSVKKNKEIQTTATIW